ncbi:MAG: MinD/ParA family ATP-binding protein [Candidatus Dormibacteria bacterium]
MSVTVAVLTPRAGQGSTSWALALAWEASESATVLLVDADPQGGTVADLLGLDLGPGANQVGMARLFGPTEVGARLLEANAVAVPGRSRLRVVPGLSGFCGPSVGSFLPRFRERPSDGSYYADGQSRRLPISLASVAADLVIVDLGAPLAHPELQAPQRVAESITSTFQRVFIVMRDSPALVAHNLQVLQAARLARGEVILGCRSGRGGDDRDLRRTMRSALAQSVPDVVLGAEWPWRPELAQRAEERGEGMPALGLARSLGLLVPGVSPPSPAAREITGAP